MSDENRLGTNSRAGFSNFEPNQSFPPETRAPITERALIGWSTSRRISSTGSHQLSHSA
jgi:hypothetical protein